MAQSPQQTNSQSAIARVFSSIGSGNKKPTQQQQLDSSKFKFDPMTGKPVKPGQNITSQQQTSDLEGDDSNNPDKKNAKSPLDDFMSLLDNDDTGEEGNTPPSLSLQPDKLQEYVAKMDFTSDLPQEMQLALANMGEQGKVYLGLLNHVGRKAYSNAMHHSSVLTDTGLNKRLEHEGKNVDGRIRSHLVRSRFNQANVHPVVKQFQSMLGEMLASKNPDASPEWIQEQTNSFFSLLGQHVSPKGQNGGTGEDGGEVEDVNWLDYRDGKSVAAAG